MRVRLLETLKRPAVAGTGAAFILRGLTLASRFLLTLLLAYFFVTIAVSVELPAGLLPDSKPSLYRAFKSKKKPAPTREGRRRRVANIGNVPASYDPLRAAFFVSWDANSLASLNSFLIC